MEERQLRMSEILVYFVKKYQDKWEEVFRAIQLKERVNKEEVHKVIDDLANKNITYTTMVDNDYPDKYKNGFYKPPFAIFTKDNKTTTRLYELL